MCGVTAALAARVILMVMDYRVSKLEAVAWVTYKFPAGLKRYYRLRLVEGLAKEFDAPSIYYCAACYNQLPDNQTRYILDHDRFSVYCRNCAETQDFQLVLTD
jgi:hypothetical protein